MSDPVARPDFIFMLTRNDRTVADAAGHLETALTAGVRHLGCNDVGLDIDSLARLAARIRDAGAVSYPEVVSLNPRDEICLIEAGVLLGVDTILGGVNVAQALPILQGRKIGYYPFAGQVYGHPSILSGSPDEIAASADPASRSSRRRSAGMAQYWRRTRDDRGGLQGHGKAGDRRRLHRRHIRP